MKATKELGRRKALNYLVYEPLSLLFRLIPYSPLKVNFLRFLGAKIRKNSVIWNIKFFNVYVNGFKNLTLGKDSFIGEDCLLDLADKIIIGNKVTLAERVNILTHTNVGYKDHPLQKKYSKKLGKVIIKDGCFIGTNSTILSGVTINNNSLVAANSLVKEDVPPNTLVGGSPAKKIKNI